MDYRFKPAARVTQVAALALVFIFLATLPTILNAIIPESADAQEYSAIELSGPDSEWKIPIHNADDSEIVFERLFEDPTALEWNCNGTIVVSKVVISTGPMETITRRMLRSTTFSNSALDAQVIERNNVFRAGTHQGLIQASAITIQGSGDHNDEIMVALVYGENYEIMADLIWKRLAKADDLPQFNPNTSSGSEIPERPHLPAAPEGFGDAI